jgi:hypothetical protein
VCHNASQDAKCKSNSVRLKHHTAKLRRTEASASQIAHPQTQPGAAAAPAYFAISRRLEVSEAGAPCLAVQYSRHSICGIVQHSDEERVWQCGMPRNMLVLYLCM